jgi:hypothetical protein
VRTSPVTFPFSLHASHVNPIGDFQNDSKSYRNLTPLVTFWMLESEAEFPETNGAVQVRRAGICQQDPQEGKDLKSYFDVWFGSVLESWVRSALWYLFHRTQRKIIIRKRNTHTSTNKHRYDPHPSTRMVLSEHSVIELFSTHTLVSFFRPLCCDRAPSVNGIWIELCYAPPVTKARVLK